MKKMIITSVATFLTALMIACNSSPSSKIKAGNIVQAEKRDKKISVGVPAIVFDKETYDFGTVKEGFVVKTSFKITNSGKSDLVITNAKASCGCTVPTWPKDPVKPGNTAEVKVRFDTSGKPNQQSKTITLFTNTEKGQEQLKISGMVTPKNKK